MRRSRAKVVQSDRPETLEPDSGYGASHGYAPGHGGPSGPGDVPADEVDGRAEDAGVRVAHTPLDSRPPAERAIDDEESLRPSEVAPDENR
jgi:hypothetical protein